MIFTVRLSVLVIIFIYIVTCNSFGVENSKTPSESREWKPLINKFSENLILRSKNDTQRRQDKQNTDERAVEEGRKKHKLFYPGIIGNCGRWNLIQELSIL